MIEKNPSRITVANVYAKRALRWRRNSYPYISGDAFADFADYVYEPPPFRNFNKALLQNARVIFVRGEKLAELLSEHHQEIRASVIVTGNSDFEFHSVPTDIPICVKAFFLQNSFISDDERFFSIPIGIENFRWGVNGNPKFIKHRGALNISEPKVLFGPFGKTHPIREVVARDFVGKSDRWHFLAERKSPKDFENLTKKYSHVAAVRGNGVDTHRLWESLYRGVTPIVEKSAWWDSLSSTFPEVEIVNSWTHESVLEVLDAHQNRPNYEHNPSLWMPFWEDKIKRFLN